MKFYGNIIATFAIQTATAFVYPPLTKTFNSNIGHFSYAFQQSAPDGTSSGGLAKGPGSPGSSLEPAPISWQDLPLVKVQGGALRTWSLTDPNVERVQVIMRTEGRPLMANVELWQGPDNTPEKMAVYLEDGGLRPFSAVIETPRGTNAVAIYNTHSIEYPIEACVEADVDPAVIARVLENDTSAKLVQGGAINTVPFAPAVSSVQVLIKTDGRPLNARIELLQGPNNNKQVIEFYSEDGEERPFFGLIETPGVGNVVRICNTATVEFPMSVIVKPFTVDPGFEEGGKFIVS